MTTEKSVLITAAGNGYVLQLVLDGVPSTKQRIATVENIGVEIPALLATRIREKKRKPAPEAPLFGKEAADVAD